MTRLRVFIISAVLSSLLTACGAPAATQPSSDQVATSVAGTLAAVSPSAPQASALPSPPPGPSAAPDLLPHSVYFLNNDKAGLLQVFRVQKDGKTFQQITFEPSAVDSFDVSPVDGSVVYATNNQLYLVDADGAGRKLLVDGGPVDDSNRFTNSVGMPVWSPDGKTIAFSHGGLSFYAAGTGAITKVLENQVDTSAGFPVVRELYAPNRYSPDGTKLLITITFNEAGTFGIYRPSDNSLVRFTRPDGGIVCCEVRWVPEGTGLYVASSTIGMVESGLFFVDASTGQVNTLLPGSAPDGTYNFAAGPQVGPDGKLYFFFNNLPQIPTSGHTPLQLVRSGTDGVTDRSQLVPETFQNLNEVLWAPDASLAIVAEGPTADVYAGGVASVIYPDGRPDVKLTDFAESMHWGP